MTNERVAQELVELASLLDDAGFKKEANVLDAVLKRVAQTEKPLTDIKQSRFSRGNSTRTASLESHFRGRLQNLKEKREEMSFRLQDPNLSEEKKIMIALEQKMLAAQIEAVEATMAEHNISSDPYGQWGEDAHWMKYQERDQDYGDFDDDY